MLFRLKSSSWNIIPAGSLPNVVAFVKKLISGFGGLGCVIGCGVKRSE